MLQCKQILFEYRNTMVFTNHHRAIPTSFGKLRGKESDQIGWIDPALWSDFNTPDIAMSTKIQKANFEL